MSKRNEAEETKALAPVGANLPAEVMEAYQTDAGAGSEEVGNEDLAVPILRIIQKGSPQVDPNDPGYLGGAVVVGDLLNTITGEMFETSQKGTTVSVIPCHYRREVLRWRLREKGGGLRERYTPEEAEPLFATCTKDDKGRDVLPGGEEHLVATANHYVMFPDGTFAVIPMASTQMKKSRAWNTMIASWRLRSANGTPFTPPSFAKFYELGTVGEKNEKGSWMGWTVKPGERVPSDLYAEARKFHELVKGGQVQIVDGEEQGDGNGSAEAAA